MTNKKAIKELEAARKRIGIQRDKLCDIRDEMETLAEAWHRADQSLMEAIDALSELA